MNIYIPRYVFYISFFVGCLFTNLVAQNDEEVIIYVKNTTEQDIGNNDLSKVHTYGKSWDTAFRHLHDALRFGDPNATQMWIAGGHYYVDRGIALTNQTGETEPNSGHISPYLVLNRNLKIYGGFAGTETSLDQRDPEANPTYLDGNVFYKDKHDFPVPDNIFNTFNRFSKRIMIAYNSTLTLDGLIFQYVFGGESAASGEVRIIEADQGNGAFVRAHQSALTINNCLFRYATEGLNGQMVYATNSTEPLRITNSRFTESGNARSFFRTFTKEGDGRIIFENNIVDNIQSPENGENILFENAMGYVGGNAVTEIKNSLLYNNDRLQIEVTTYVDE